MSVSKLKEVREQVKAWTNNRKLYPGWVVAPYRVRENLWDYTQYWVRPIIACLPQMGTSEIRPEAAAPPEKAVSERLNTLDELNWRFETALVPLAPHIVEAIVPCLEEVNPFSDALRLPSPILALTPENLDALDWMNLRQVWLRLALGLLRFYRGGKKLR